jgi:hypothetical protein
MAENKVDWNNFSFAQRFFKLETTGNISNSVTPIGVGQLPPSVTPGALAAQLANVLKPMGYARKLMEEELLEAEDRPQGNEYLEDLAYYIVKGASRPKRDNPR